MRENPKIFCDVFFFFCLSRYTYTCTVCKASSHAHSRSKKVENIRCRYCHGRIEILINRKDKDGNVKSTPVKAASGFAKFVKEQYARVKTPALKHADVMKLLGSKFSELDVDEKNKYNLVTTAQ